MHRTGREMSMSPSSDLHNKVAGRAKDLSDLFALLALRIFACNPTTWGAVGWGGVGEGQGGVWAPKWTTAMSSELHLRCFIANWPTKLLDGKIDTKGA